MKNLMLSLAALNAGKVRREFDEAELAGTPASRRPFPPVLKALRAVELGASRSPAYVKQRQKRKPS